MAATQGILVNLPNGGIEIKARRKLNDPTVFEALLDEIQNLLASRGPEQPAVIEDLDVSQNSLTAEQFGTLFAMLASTSARVQRYRMFGCPAFDDEAARLVSEYFRDSVTPETAPHELHLSDCAITTDGFMLFMDAIESSEVYPLKHPVRGRSVPLYLRLENNFIDPAQIQEKVDAGVIHPNDKSKRTQPGPGAKVQLVVVSNKPGYQQKSGTPPAPEDAPAPKQVVDTWPKQQQQQQQQWGPQGGKGWAKNWQPAVRAPLIRANAPVQPIVQLRSTGITPPGRIVGAAGAAGKGVQQAKGAQQQAALKFNSKGGWPQGTSGSNGSADRSRTPVQRAQGQAGAAARKPAAKKSSDLPRPWEEHWSEEYAIPYYWNAETGDALWEKPTA